MPLLSHNSLKFCAEKLSADFDSTPQMRLIANMLRIHRYTYLTNHTLSKLTQFDMAMPDITVLCEINAGTNIAVYVSVTCLHDNKQKVRKAC